LIIAESDTELELGDALELLADAWPTAEPTGTATESTGRCRSRG
jgi:hypothetical protein